MMRKIYLLMALLASLKLHAQKRTERGDMPLKKAPLVSSAQKNDGDEYRNKSNVLYWKNRKPDNDYWQQDVHYNIDARIDETENIIYGKEALSYWNNSPDKLEYVYFHLYQNAFIKGSHLHNLELNNKVSPKLGKHEEQGLGTVIDSVMVDGQLVKVELDNTILKVYLPQPLKPGAKINIGMNFATYYDKGATRRRMQMWNAWGFTHYNGVQWYPKLSVYDRKLGWDTYQHLNKEFYGDFGSWDVKLDVPSNYIVEATGVLQNKDEVLPEDLLKKIQIKNFAGKKWDEAPSIITPYKKGERKVWHFKALNVHDFAFTADPSYRMDITYVNGVQCVALVQEPHAAGWQNASEYVAKIIKTFSDDIGPYGYPKMVAADAQDGMEYPMLTLDGGSEPGYRGLFVHEIGHNWFYGMVGSNETYRAAMDEGFTQFLTAWGLKRIDGDTMVASLPKDKWHRRFNEPQNPLDRNVLNAYTIDALNQDETPINTHSDDFNNALNHNGGYREVYFKTASMLYNLQYTLGDSLFSGAMKNYFHRWSYCHPYFEDFKKSVMDFTHVDLNWFFDEWFETTKTIDYKIGKIKRLPALDSFTITFKRKGEMQMPIDFRVISNDGRSHDFHIPNTWFVKETNAKVLPKWYGWGKLLYPEYTAHIYVPGGINSVQIDPTYRLADVAMTDNYRSTGLLSCKNALLWKWDAGLFGPTDRRHYRIYIRPDVWWNSIDGVKLGAHWESHYLNTLYKIDGSVWWNTHVLQSADFKPQNGEGMYTQYAPFNYSLNYQSPIHRRYNKLQLQLHSSFIDGLVYNKAGVNYIVNGNNSLRFYGINMYRQNAAAFNYLIYPELWSSNADNRNNSINLDWKHDYNSMAGNGGFVLSVRAPFLNSGQFAFNYSYVQLEEKDFRNLGKLKLRTRLISRWGASNQMPIESAMYAAGANPEQWMDDKYSRSLGYLANTAQNMSATDLGHIQMGGGLNLRGYAGYTMPFNRNNETVFAWVGNGGTAINAELDFDNYIKLRPKYTRNWLHTAVYIFADAGAMQLTEMQGMSNNIPHAYMSNIYDDAGIGFAFTIKKWGVFDKAKPLTLRIDLPFYLSNAPVNTGNLAMRYVIGISRAF